MVTHILHVIGFGLTVGIGAGVAISAVVFTVFYFVDRYFKSNN